VLSIFINTKLHLNIGGGIAYMIKTPYFDNDDLNKRTKKVDIPLKLGLSYRFPKYLIIDTGIHTSVTKVVEDEILRTAYYLGIKTPLNQLLNK